VAPTSHMRRSIIPRFIVGALASALLVSCGGGGGTSGLPGLPNRFVYASANHETPSGQSLQVAGGIYAYQLDSSSGTMRMVAGSPFATETHGARFVMSRDAKFLYVSYSSVGAATGSLFGYRIQADGSLVSVPGSPYATAEPISDPVANPGADSLYTVSYSGVLSVYAIDPSTGALTLQSTQPFPAVATPLITPDGRYAYVLLVPEVYEYSIDAASGALTALPGSPVSLHFAEDFSPAEATIDPSGKFIYITNAVVTTGFGGPAYGLAIEPQSSTVSIAWSGSPTPGPQWSVTVDSSGKYVVMSTVVTSKTTQNCFAVLTMEPTGGALQQVPGSPFPGSPGHAGYDCGVFLSDAAGPYIYEGSDTGVYVYSLDLTSGVPTQVVAAAIPEQQITGLAVTH
jgi:Lactonase, 7-bladed beta-propeller